MKKLYLDIDGVLVSGGKATEGIVEFLKFATDNFDCYWLTEEKGPGTFLKIFFRFD